MSPAGGRRVNPDEMADLELAAGFTQAADDPHCSECEQPIEPCGGNPNCVHVQAGLCVKHMLKQLPQAPRLGILGCTEPYCDGPPGHDGQHFQWVPE